MTDESVHPRIRDELGERARQLVRDIHLDLAERPRREVIGRGERRVR